MEGKDYRKAAEDIIRIVGKDNIVSATHCATRLRLIVKDKEAIDIKKLEKTAACKRNILQCRTVSDHSGNRNCQ